MQQLIRAFIVVFAFAITGSLTVQAAKPIIEVTQNVPVYDNRTGQLVEIGQLIQGETYTVEKSYGDNWWQIRWSNHYAYLAKNRTKQVQAVTYRNATTIAPMQKNVIANRNVGIMDNKTVAGSLKEFAVLKQGQSYPVISKMGNWYGVELNGRLGFVYHMYVDVTDTSPSKPPVTTPPKNPIAKTGMTTTYAEVIDFRRDKPMTVARLYGNTPIQYVDDPADSRYTTHVKVRWGDALTYISRSAVKEQMIDANRFTKLRPTGKFIIPYNSQSNHIYTNEGGKLTAFAHLDTNQRFPLIRTEGNWYVTVIAGREGYIHNSKAALDRGVAVLMYHHVLPEVDLGFFKHKSTTVTSEQFNREMAYLNSQNYETIKLEEFRRYLKRQITLPTNSVVLTFDDGLLSTREYAYPILKKYNFKASQFLITARNDIANSKQVFSPNVLQALSWKDIENMSDVFSFEGHTYNLHNLVGRVSNVLTVSNAQLAADLKRNISSLPKGPRAFAYPFGQFNANTVQLVKNAGFDLALTTRLGYNSPYEDPFYIKRVSSDQSVSLEQYKRLVRPF